MTPEARAARDRIQAYLDGRTHILGDLDQIAEAKNAGTPWAHLTVTDLRTVLAALDQQPTAIIEFPGDMSQEDVDRFHRAWDAANGTGDFLRFTRIHTDASTHTTGVDPGMGILGPSRLERAREYLAERKLRRQHPAEPEGPKP